jgi:hypothetical protein
MTNTKRIIAFITALTICTAFATGCSSKNKSSSESAATTETTAETATDSEEIKENPVKATPVSYSKDGMYKTTVSSDEVDLSGLTTDNIEISYLTNINKVINEDSGLVYESDEKESVEVKVESVSKNDKDGIDITFTDETPYEYVTDSYTIFFDDIDGGVSVPVEFSKIKLTPDVDAVMSSDKETKITLTIDGSEFENEVTKEDISLDDAFSAMKVDSVSASGKNLTMKLSGEPVRNEAGVYQWGTISVSPKAIKDGYVSVSANIDVQSEYAGFDSSSLKFADGNVTADLIVCGVADIDSLTKDNIKIEGVTIENVEKKDDGRVTLTMSEENIKSVNDFVDLISGKSITIGSYDTMIGLSQADFYPVFDYVDEKGEDLELTLKLYAFYGDFDSSISTSQFSFGDDFEGAKAESVEIDNDGIAELIISVPANGQDSDNFLMNGTVTVKAGALVNNWGEKTTKECSYTREYSAETLGRNMKSGGAGLSKPNIMLNEETLLEIQKYVRGKDTKLGTIIYWGGVASQVFSIAKTVLELTGVIKSEHQQLMEAIAQVDKKVSKVLENQFIIMNDLEKMTGQIVSGANETYQKDLATLRTNIDNMTMRLKNGALYMALEDAVASGKLDKMPSFAGMRREVLEAEKEKYRQLYAPNVDNMTDKEAADYNERLTDYLTKREQNEFDKEFAGYTNTYNELYKSLNDVACELARNDSSNPIIRYDEICATAYNFDSQCYEFRLAQRTTAEYLINKGLALVGYYNKIDNYPNNPDFEIVQDNVQKALNQLEAMSNIGHPVSEVDAVVGTKEVEIDGKFIGEVKLAGDANSAETAKKYLTDEGYTVIDKNLNDSFGGHYIYLGYKTTDSYDDAIKRFACFTGNDDDEPIKVHTAFEDHIGFNTFDPTPYTGDDVFIKNKGGLDTGVPVEKKGSLHYDYYLYYTKDEFNDKKAVVNMYFDDDYDINQKDRSYCSFNNTQFAIPGVEVFFLHYDTATTPGKTKVKLPTGKNPEYYPYCYVLGKKIFAETSDDSERFQGKYGALHIKDRFNTYNTNESRNWSEIELNKFKGKMRTSSFKDEFADAGMILPYGLLIESQRKLDITKTRASGDMYTFTVEGKIIEPGSNTATSYYREGAFGGEFSSNYISRHIWASTWSKAQFVQKHKFVILYLY